MVALVVKVAAAAAAVLMENHPQREVMPVLFNLTVTLLCGQRCQGIVHHLLIALYALVMLALRMVAQKLKHEQTTLHQSACQYQLTKNIRLCQQF